MGTFSIHNFGCRVNQAEGFDWAGELQKRGLRLESDPGRSRIVIVNTCTLTGRADRDGRKFIRKILRENPRARMVITGCLAERRPREFEKNPGIWKVLSNKDKAGLPDLVVPRSAAGPAAESKPFRARALLKVQDGCDQACTFCIIPGVRGRSVSVPLPEARARAEALAARGFKEIVLTGIHLCSYGRDLRPKSSLLELLREIEAASGDFRIRLSSLDPRLLSRPVLEHVTMSAKISTHFHLSLQHASRPVLRAMGRTSTVDSYRRILAFLRARSPRAAIGADVIVGFPGETAGDFRELSGFLEDAPLSYAHVFAYSPRPGTAAHGRAAVDETVKRDRAARLRKISRAKNEEFRKVFVGKTLDGIVVHQEAERAEILTSNYIDVRVGDCPADYGAAVKVRIRSVTDRETIGIILPS
jgi:threonylcarbamoyladenosine tRNA methylthiotransferase MtaB